MKTVLITGVAGFIGSYAAQHFSEHKWSVIGIDSISTEYAPLSNLDAYYCMNLPDKAFVDLLLKHCPDVCIHCAGRASVPLSVSSPLADFYANTVLTFEILNAIRLNVPECRFILLSSAAVYGNPQTLPVNELQPCAPISPYGFHKWQSEQLCLEYSSVYGLKTTAVRIFSAYGQGLRRQVLWDICRKIIVEKSLVLQGTGSESRDFIHALDIAKAIEIIAVNAPMNGDVYNVASGYAITIRELATIMLNSLGSDCIIQFDSAVPAGVPLNWQADISKLNSLDFVVSIPLQQGIKNFASWCRTEMTGICRRN